jgi:hypothetical protein
MSWENPSRYSVVYYPLSSSDDDLNRAIQESKQTHEREQKRNQEGFTTDRDKSISCPGLCNLRNTCYVNSLLQSYLYCHPTFTKLVLQFSQKDFSSNPQAIRVLNSLQKLFTQMYTSPKVFLSPTEFLETLQVDFTQQDVSDFNHQFLELLSHALETVKQKETFEALFQGKKHQTTIQGKQIEKGVFPFGPGDLNLSLDRNNQTDIISAFRSQLSHERVSDELTIEAKFEFPPILWVNIKRFDFNSYSQSAEKINSEFRFEQNLDLSEFVFVTQDSPEVEKLKLDRIKVLDHLEKIKILEGTLGHTRNFLQERLHTHRAGMLDFDKVPLSNVNTASKVLEQYLELFTLETLNWTQKLQSIDESLSNYNHLTKEHVKGTGDGFFRLHSVLVHSGTPTCGHYYAFVQSPSGSWLKCNDQTVSVVDISEVMASSFGGVNFGPSAYCLMYVRSDVSFPEDFISSVLPPDLMISVPESDDPIAPADTQVFRPDDSQIAQALVNVEKILTDLKIKCTETDNEIRSKRASPLIYMYSKLTWKEEFYKQYKYLAQLYFLNEGFESVYPLLPNLLVPLPENNVPQSKPEAETNALKSYLIGLIKENLATLPEFEGLNRLLPVTSITSQELNQHIAKYLYQYDSMNY